MKNIPEGFKLVPVEPTEEMLQAAYTEMGTPSCCVFDGATYRSMLATAPAPPQPIYDEAKERELFNTWYAKNVGVLGTSTWAEYIGVWMACAQSRATAGEDDQ